MNTTYKPKYYVSEKEVIEELKKYMLIDGFDNFVLDLSKSQGAYFYDKCNGKRYTDFFTCFASMPIGFNHSKLLEDGFKQYLLEASINKPSNSDIYTEIMANFVKTFFKIAVPSGFRYSFFIEGGALAVENALKTAFDWKIKKNFKKGHISERGTQIIHFKEAFHGRSGYTMSLTNTDPTKTELYPKFKWPRIINPKLTFPLNELNLEKTLRMEGLAIAQIKQTFLDNPDDIAAIIIEPIQGEGGDNHFRPEFLQSLKDLTLENDVLLIFDEIQTGVGLTGTMWAHEQMNVQPDIMTFGKKMQVCGIIVGERIDEVEDNVFHHSSRINSTWGGNLADMARATRYLEIIEEEQLLENVKKQGVYLQERLLGLEEQHKDTICNVRGRGLFCAFDFKDVNKRAKFRELCFDDGLLILPCGERSIRFRPALNITREQLNEGLNIIEKALKTL